VKEAEEVRQLEEAVKCVFGEQAVATERDCAEY
jgi:hypothetical protein